MNKHFIFSPEIFYQQSLKKYRVRQTPFCLENALKKLLNIFSNFFFYWKVQSFWLIMENNFIQVTKQWLVLDASAFQCMRAGCLCPKFDNFACLHTRQIKMSFIWKDDFFLPKSKSSVSRSQVHLAKRCSSVYATIYVRRKDKTNCLSVSCAPNSTILLVYIPANIKMSFI